MWWLPHRLVLTAGSGIGSTSLTAFDNALIAAGISDFNLVKVTSILPAGSKVFYSKEGEHLLAGFPRGSILPVVYSSIVSVVPGETISAALAIGIPKDLEKNGVIFEATAQSKSESSRGLAAEMVSEALRNRQIGSFDIVDIVSEITVRNQTACAICAAILLP